MFVGGTAWIGILASFNYAAKPWLRLGCEPGPLSMYLLVMQGGMSVGSAIWGAVAARIGVPAALSWAGLALVAGLLTIRSHRLSFLDLELAPAGRPD